MKKPKSAPRRKELPVPDLPRLVGETSKLRQNLQKLLTRFGDEADDPQGRIFPRFMSHSWRNMVGDLHGPYGEKRAVAVVWIDEASSYLNRLREYFAVHLQSDVFQRLPFTGTREYSAEECLRLLKLQEEALERLFAKEQLARPDNSENWRDALKRAVQEMGLGRVALEAGIDPKTVAKLLKGGDPQKRTREKLEKFRKSRR